MKKDSGIKSILQSVHHYLIFFLIIAFVITCCIMLFVNILQNTMGVRFTEEQISAAAKLTLPAGRHFRDITEVSEEKCTVTATPAGI